MNISNFNKTELTSAYGILCGSTPKASDRDALYPTFCRILKNEESTRHSHFEPELFYIMNGTGLMEINGEVAEVTPGDLVRIPSFSQHQLKNIGFTDLEFLSVYSEDFATPLVPLSMTITAAPPTPNGPLHLGHISGPYLASDILARYLRSRSVQVVNHSGTDDHQNYVSEKAHSLHQDVEDFREQMRSRIQKGLHEMQIEFDEFIEPKTDKEYQNKIQKFATKAISSGIIEKELVAFPYCNTCDHFLVDSLIDGNCSACEQPSRGNCENCGIVVPPWDLRNTNCARCGTLSTPKSISVFTFSLSKYLPLIEKDLKNLSLPVNLQNLVERISKIRDLKVLVSHPSGGDQGLTLPESDQTIHVWFEMAAHYESFALSKTAWTHCFGFDNSFHYLLFIPALLRALNPQAKLPDAVIANEFLLLDGLKFSTSRGHAIWADEFKGSIEHLRLFLSLERPAKLQSNFSLKTFQDFSESLEQKLQQLSHRSKFCEEHSTSAIYSQAIIDCHRFTRDMEFFLAPQNFDLRRAARRLFDFMDLTLQNQNQSEKLMLSTLANFMAIFMPTEAKRLTP